MDSSVPATRALIGISREPRVCPIISITNAQNRNYWQDKQLKAALDAHDDIALMRRKRELKKELFEIVADQTGKIFDPDVLTIVWARRFAEYKRADMIARDLERFQELLGGKMPVQMIYQVKVMWMLIEMAVRM